MRDRRKPSRGDAARELAFRILRRVEQGGAYASALLDHYQPGLEDPRDAALVREVVLGVLRQRSALDHVLTAVSSRPLDRVEAAVLTALRLTAYEILFLDRVPEFASVDRGVALLKRHRHAAAAGFANGVLRAVARAGRDALPASPAAGDDAALALAHSHPRWWVERLVARVGRDAARALLEADNRRPPTVLRPDLRRVGADELRRTLAAEGVTTEPGARVAEALHVRSGFAQRTAAFRRGLAWVQDEAAQLVPLLFGPALRRRVADVCAAPGGKALQLATTLPADGFVVACDRHPGRLRRLQANVRRVGAANVWPMVADMSLPRPALRGAFDHVLVDAPCTGTGTLRRHPEIRWRIEPGDPARLAVLQQRILETSSALVAPGGSLVYAVCSLEPEEGPGVVDAFLARHPEFAVVDPRPGLPEPARALVDARHALRTSPADGDFDGFFAVRLERRGPGPGAGS